MCYKDPPGLLTASVVWPGAWRGPIGIKPGRIYPRSPPDQPSDWRTTKDCSALVPNLSTIAFRRFYIGPDLILGLRSNPAVIVSVSCSNSSVLHGSVAPGEARGAGTIAGCASAVAERVYPAGARLRDSTVHS
jgi:hypothetical protein